MARREKANTEENRNDLPEQTVWQEHSESPRSLWWHSWQRLRKNRLAMFGMWTILILIVVAAGAPFFAPHPPTRQILDYSDMDEGFTGSVLVKKSVGSYGEELIPVTSYEVVGDSVRYEDSFDRTYMIALSDLEGDNEEEWHQEPIFLLGTDNFGRDVLSRLIYGTRISIGIGLLAELMSLFIGVTLGAFAGYFRGVWDSVIMYVANVVWSFPYILLVIALSLVIGVGFVPTFVAIGIASWVDMCRIVRGQFFSLRETEYVEATRALGFTAPKTIFRHILPNALGPITVIATAGFAMAIIAEASLSFIGIGIQKPTPSWGLMISEGRENISAGVNMGQMIYPCICLALAVFGFNLFGDGLRDALDPKLKK